MRTGRSSTWRRSRTSSGGARSSPTAGRFWQRAGSPQGGGGAGRESPPPADAAGGEPVSHAHVATGDGEAFCVREGGYVAVAVTDRFTLASLMIFDIRIVLRRL